METLHGAGGPSETSLRVTQIGHDVAILPAAALGTRSAQVAGRWRTVMDRSQSENKETRPLSMRHILIERGKMLID